ncbi:centrosomal protein of 78 kDa isoform X2 [Halyomorpha halys]|uniref:centrosomal protein of 78 kDa isoform X2 n=1 Tax=Halyomorpha halys TaxID=286706 RepID=UPI0006D4E63F|nr:centrosomal protein of 78 kDa-like isoform X2 [Halyomorpha halys]
MLAVDETTRLKPLNENYVSLEVNADNPELVDLNSLLHQKNSRVHCLELYNSSNQSKEIDLKLFLAIKCNLLYNDSLAVLILKKIILGKEQTELLAEALSTARWIQHLSLQECGLTDECCKILCDSLPKAPSVSTLDISGNKITADGALVISNLLKHEAMARGISCWIRSLRGRTVDKKKVLGLSRLTLNNNFITDQGLSYIVESLYDDFWIKAIDMQNCCLTNEGAKLVLSLLDVNRDIAVFDMRHNTGISLWLLASIIKRIAINKKSIPDETGGEWLSNENETIENIPEYEEIIPKSPPGTRGNSRTNISSHLRRTQSCLISQRNQRLGGVPVWQRASAEHLKQVKSVVKA